MTAFAIEGPSRSDSALFLAKASVLRLRRGCLNLVRGIRRYGVVDPGGYPHVLGESRSRLFGETDAGELRLQLGKVQNLRMACRRIDGVGLPAGGVFSFWKQVGRAAGFRGFVHGRQLREGCLFPAVGGGLCQLSNALYDAALLGGAEIVERHGHSARVPNSAAALGRDATVAWNYIDLRFSFRGAVLIEAFLSADALTVRILGASAGGKLVGAVRGAASLAVLGGAAHSCFSCNQASCFRHAGAQEHAGAPAGRTAMLLDCYTPEFQGFLDGRMGRGDLLFVPLNPRRFHRGNYNWRAPERNPLVTATVQTLLRSGTSRRFSARGSARLLAQLRCDEKLARWYGRRIPYDVSELVVAQNLAPFLQRDGYLGGRRYTVLASRLPLGELHAVLDGALAEHPERGTLGEYRAPAWIVEAERRALEGAESIVTAHGRIAGLFPGKARLLSWDVPGCEGVDGARLGTHVVFPGPVAARKGAYELRAALRRMAEEDSGRVMPLLVLGRDLQGGDFFGPLGAEYFSGGAGRGGWLGRARVVVQPALIEESPRHLVGALAHGVPVIATAAAGLGSHPLLRVVRPSNVEDLLAALREVCGVGRGEAAEAWLAPHAS